jgi:hypothetical protein
MPSFPLGQSVGGIGLRWWIAPTVSPFSVSQDLLHTMVGPRTRKFLGALGLKEGSFGVAAMKFAVAVRA